MISRLCLLSDCSGRRQSRSNISGEVCNHGTAVSLEDHDISINTCVVVSRSSGQVSRWHTYHQVPWTNDQSRQSIGGKLIEIQASSQDVQDVAMTDGLLSRFSHCESKCLHLIAMQSIRSTQLLTQLSCIKYVNIYRCIRDCRSLFIVRRRTELLRAHANINGAVQLIAIDDTLTTQVILYSGQPWS